MKIKEATTARTQAKTYLWHGVPSLVWNFSPDLSEALLVFIWQDNFSEDSPDPCNLMSLKLHLWGNSKWLPSHTHPEGAHVRLNNIWMNRKTKILTCPPLGWYLMLSVDPILDLTFLRSGRGWLITRSCFGVAGDLGGVRIMATFFSVGTSMADLGVPGVCGVLE